MENQSNQNLNPQDPQLKVVNSEGISAQVSAAAPFVAVNAAQNENQNQNPFRVDIPQMPTQDGGNGVLYDFNDGARVFCPQGKWYVQLEDSESGNILFSAPTEGGWVLSTKKYYVPFTVRVWKQGEQKPFLEHSLNLKGKHVQIQMPVGTIGDIVGWLPYAEKFQQKHGCITELTLGKEMSELFASQYPAIKFTAVPQEKPVITKPYATYKLGLFFRGDVNNQPIDFRKLGLHRGVAYILGVDPKEEPPRVKLGNERKIKEKYVCIASKASSQSKMWNNGFGWVEAIKYLKTQGYRVLCIDRDNVSGMNFTWNQIPYGAEDFTGNISLQERIALMEHADFFIGLSSGLSWLAWCCKKPVIMISGFTLPICEFDNPYRVFNSHGCNGCWDDVNENFDHKDFFWCPKHKGTDRQFECTRLITPKQVIGHIDRLIKDYNYKK
ncbi:MAG: autotransporter strand-loop-strand O-heptosyltransferase [Endomicrobium sp.]|jgi:autotransporter strand-loop-strand O-heptosyltransferase|nr:autotransporter strand-loop-strand O-heptosyltransferase [Endomicrobium sp.]